MLQIEEWFRRPQRRTERKAAPAAKPVTAAVHRSQETAAEFAAVPKAAESNVVELKAAERKAAEPKVAEPKVAEPAEKEWTGTQKTEKQDFTAAPERTAQIPFTDATEDMFEPEEAVACEYSADESQEDVALQDSVAEAEELEHISEQIGQDVTDMIDMKKEDFLLQQIDEFREKAKQLQQLMKNRETKAKELQETVDAREAKASELDSLIHVRKGEADKIMKNVSVRIDEMSAGVRNEMSGLSDTLSREVSGLSQNLTQELNQSTEKTRQVVEAATQNMIDQNTRSLEGLKEQLEQLDQREKINELSTEMNSQITTLKTDIADKIHAEDVKCYRNIQASMDEQSKLLSEGDEKTRQHIQEQVDNLSRQMRSQTKLSKASLTFSILNFLGVVGILVYLILF
ncbi:MAG: hypothetical protein J6C00_09675 [Eubacterium sp.]|nr:hypothetical protein [Eubacterium sp.]